VNMTPSKSEIIHIASADGRDVDDERTRLDQQYINTTVTTGVAPSQLTLTL